MLSLAPTVRVFVVVEPFDMRGSFNSLAGAVRRLGLDPVDGHLYLFLNKRRRLARALWFDGSSWCLLAKRLEAAELDLGLGDAPAVDRDGEVLDGLGGGGGLRGAGGGQGEARAEQVNWEPHGRVDYQEMRNVGAEEEGRA